MVILQRESRLVEVEPTDVLGWMASLQIWRPENRGFHRGNVPGRASWLQLRRASFVITEILVFLLFARVHRRYEFAVAVVRKGQDATDVSQVLDESLRSLTPAWMWYHRIHIRRE